MKIYTVEIESCIYCPNSGYDSCSETGERLKWDVIPENCPLPELEETQCK